MTELEGHQNAVIFSKDSETFVLPVNNASVSNITIYQKRDTTAR